jgi:hypothetical protein
VAWVLLALAACSGLTSSDTTPVAVEFVAPPDTIAVADTVPLHIRALNRTGDSIVGASIVLVSLTPDTIGVDSARLAVIGLLAGRGRVVARAGSLPSNALTIVVK